MWLTKSYSFIKTRIDYHIKKSVVQQEESEPHFEQVVLISKQRGRSMSANGKLKINVIKDYYKLSKDDQHIFNSLEINEITFIEEKAKECKVLEKKDWQLILKNKTFKGYNVQQIHQSVLLQTLEYDMQQFIDVSRRQWWIFISNQEQNKSELKKKPYSELKKSNTIHRLQIEKDACRSIIHEMFKQHENLQSLKNILIAFANFDTELGYVQGLNIIVAHLLVCYDLSVNDQQLSDFVVMDEDRDETVFFLLIYIMKDQNWRTIFLEGLEGLRIRVDVLEQMMRKKLPDLHKHFYNEGITDFFPFFSRFYMTLLMYNIPWQISRMILDLFLFEGEDIIHKLILAMLQYHKNKLLMRNQIEIRQFCAEQMAREFFELFSMPKTNLISVLSTLKLL